MSPSLDTSIQLTRTDDVLTIHLLGAWKLSAEMPDADHVRRQVAQEAGISSVAFDTTGLIAWDSSLVLFLHKAIAACMSKDIDVDLRSLPAGVQRLLALAGAVPEREGVHREHKRENLLARTGLRAYAARQSIVETLEFLGTAGTAFIRLLLGKARFQSRDLLLYIQESGVQALPIITLVSALVGLIIAFIGAVQLEMFGAEIYVANLVGIGMARDMGAMMTGIVMAGRTGASYAAQLGTMQVNEEIDALKTLGISPMEFLVLPRIVALSLMLPLLTVYSDLMGMAGGALVGVGLFDITLPQYYQQTKGSVPLHHFGTGLVKSIIYGIIVAVTGCMQGVRCGRSASAVGEATTYAVVQAIIAIIVACALLTVTFHILGV